MATTRRRTQSTAMVAMVGCMMCACDESSGPEVVDEPTPTPSAANTTVPLFVQPFTTCHEIGHQLGYAKENEANFAGYLSAKSSQSALFRYSVYFDLYSYSRYYLYAQDSVAAKKLSNALFMYF